MTLKDLIISTPDIQPEPQPPVPNVAVPWVLTLQYGNLNEIASLYRSTEGKGKDGSGGNQLPCAGFAVASTTVTCLQPNATH